MGCGVETNNSIHVIRDVVVVSIYKGKGLGMGSICLKAYVLFYERDRLISSAIIQTYYFPGTLVNKVAALVQFFKCSIHYIFEEFQTKQRMNRSVSPNFMRE